MKPPITRISKSYFNPATATPKELAKAKADAKARGEELGLGVQYAEERTFKLNPVADAGLAFANGDKGSERHFLELVAADVVHGRPISAIRQKIANLLLANALREGKLPDRAPGRRADEHFAMRDVERAYRYYELLDSGSATPFEDAAAQEPTCDVKTMREAVKNYRWLIGLTIEDRDRFRRSRKFQSEADWEAGIILDLYQRAGYSPGGPPPEAKERLKGAPDLVAAARQELKDFLNPASINWPPFTEIDPEIRQDCIR